MTSLGCGKWDLVLAGRGGSPVRFQPEFFSLQLSRVLNDSNSVTATVSAGMGARSTCAEMYQSVEPWKDEIHFYRDRELVHAGPLLTVSGRSGQLTGRGLFHWMDVRFIEEDFHGSGDISHVFKGLFDAAYGKDESPNITMTTRLTGIDGVRDLKGVEFHRAADVMRELARTALDFTEDGRHILAGGVEVFEGDTPLLLLDDGVLDVDPVKDGTSFATDVAVFGGTSVSDIAATGDSRLVTAEGRSVGGTERYGLVQRSYTELHIKDGGSADANAESRRLSMSPAPVRVNATLSPNAAFEWKDVIPGRRFDVRLVETVPEEINQQMRLVSTQTTVTVSEESVTENVTIELVPLGQSEDA